MSERDHRPGGFSLELGLKDMTLVSQAAREVDAPMPFLSTLLDRYVSSKARGRGKVLVLYIYIYIYYTIIIKLIL